MLNVWSLSMYFNITLAILKYFVSLLCLRYILNRFITSDIQYLYVYNPTLHYPLPIKFASFICKIGVSLRHKIGMKTFK